MKPKEKRVDKLDIRSKCENKAKEKAKPGTQLASRLSLGSVDEIDTRPKRADKATKTREPRTRPAHPGTRLGCVNPIKNGQHNQQKK